MIRWDIAETEWGEISRIYALIMRKAAYVLARLSVDRRIDRNANLIQIRFFAGNVLRIASREDRKSSELFSHKTNPLLYCLCY